MSAHRTGPRADAAAVLHGSAPSDAHAAVDGPEDRRGVGLLDELVDEARASIAKVLARRWPLLDGSEAARVADELARNTIAVVVAVLEERGVL